MRPLAICFSLSLTLALAQAPLHETVVVTGTAEPLALDEIDRAVMVLPVRDQALVANTLVDFLRLDPSLDLEERAPNGVQSDLSIRGADFGQTLVLLNGMRLNDAQSGHHNMDIPVPLEAISRVEVLRGSGSTLYGSDAVGGVINVITQPPEAQEVRLRTAAGNFGVNQERGSIGEVFGKLSEQLTFSRDFSSGFRPDRDYRNLSLASVTHLDSGWGPSDMILAYADKPFGADQFYGNFNSWENTKTWFASLQQALGPDTSASFSFRRHSDLFVLYRDNPDYFTNHHSDETWQLSLRRSDALFRGGSLHYGVEGYHDSILSTNLGDHNRYRGAGYVSLDFRALHRFSLSIGAREEVYRSVAGAFSPTVAGGVWLSSRLKLRASASRAFRVPSYTDLYYHDPANLGSPNLRPESAWNYEGGLEWNPAGRVRADLTVFHRRVKDGIDYIRYSPTDIWRATNIANLHFTGAEAGLSFLPRRGQQIELRYTGLHGTQDAVPGIYSKYVFNYPTHAAVASWMAGLPAGMLLRTRLGVLDRRARDPYALWDLYLAETRGRIHPFLQLTNLANVSYQEILGVPMPGRAVVGGFELVVLK
ncbi:MAG TPA: TonB-dependent receptor [Bryobacteraceae bacterium]|nr:TonB-dependent receptor [Bryobacteraceae bacterium]